MHGEHAGELFAIREFNETHRDRKVGKLNGLSWKRALAAARSNEMYALNVFFRPPYSRRVQPDKDAAPAGRAEAWR